MAAGIIILVLVILAAVLAARFLFGILRIIVIIALALLALAMLYALITGDDILGISPTVSSVMSTGEDTFDTVTGVVGDAISTINQTASAAKELSELVPKAQE